MTVRRAGWRDIAVYQRGLGVPVAVAVIVALACIAGAVAFFSASTAPPGVALTALVLAGIGALATAFESIRHKIRAV